jgi:phosphatidylserine/phosphatidylglycerophosphate/cardiolipin synthase-like enzyme
LVSTKDVPGLFLRESQDVLRDLIESARSRLVLATYSFKHYSTNDDASHPLLDPLATAMHRHPGLAVDVVISLETLRKEGEVPTAQDLQRRLPQEWARVWRPGVRLPRLWIFASELERNDRGHPAGVMHAKFAVADSARVFVTSANLTAAAYERNLEMGVAFTHKPTAERMVATVDCWIGAGTLLACAR